MSIDCKIIWHLSSDFLTFVNVINLCVVFVHRIFSISFSYTSQLNTFYKNEIFLMTFACYSSLFSLIPLSKTWWHERRSQTNICLISALILRCSLAYTLFVFCNWHSWLNDTYLDFLYFSLVDFLIEFFITFHFHLQKKTASKSLNKKEFSITSSSLNFNFI